MKALPQLSDAEWQVMKAVWQNAPCLAQDIILHLADSSTWSQATIKTMLNRLVGKGAVLFEKNGKSYVYRPAFTESELRADATDSFLDKVFDGALGPMLTHFVQFKQLSKKEVESLEHLLRKQNSDKSHPKSES